MDPIKKTKKKGGVPDLSNVSMVFEVDYFAIVDLVPAIFFLF